MQFGCIVDGKRKYLSRTLEYSFYASIEIVAGSISQL